MNVPYNATWYISNVGLRVLAIIWPDASEKPPSTQRKREDDGNTKDNAVVLRYSTISSTA